MRETPARCGRLDRTGFASALNLTETAYLEEAYWQLQVPSSSSFSYQHVLVQEVHISFSFPREAASSKVLEYVSCLLNLRHFFRHLRPSFTLGREYSHRTYSAW